MARKPCGDTCIHVLATASYPFSIEWHSDGYGYRIICRKIDYLFVCMLYTYDVIHDKTMLRTK